MTDKDGTATTPRDPTPAQPEPTGGPRSHWGPQPGPGAPENAQKPPETPRKPGTRRPKREGVPAVPAAIVGADSLALSAATFGPIPTAAAAGALAVGAGAVAFRNRKRKPGSWSGSRSGGLGSRSGGSSPIGARSGRVGSGSGVRSGGSRGSVGGSGRGPGAKGSGSGLRSGGLGTRSGSGGLRSGGSGSKVGRGPGGSGKIGAGSRGVGAGSGRGPGGSKSGPGGSGRTKPGSGLRSGGLLGRQHAKHADRHRAAADRMRAKSDRAAAKKQLKADRDGLGKKAKRAVNACGNAKRAAATRIKNGRQRASRVWNSKPVAATRRGVAKTARSMWGVSAPAAAAFARGLKEAAKRKSIREIARAMRETWRKYRNKFSKSKKKKTDDAGPKVPSDKVDYPDHMIGDTSRGAAPTRGGEFDMAQSQFITAAAEMMGAAMVYDPEGMAQVGNDFNKMPEAFQNIANAMKHMAQRANDEDPIHPSILDQMQVVYGHLQQAADAAGELGPAFEKLHGVDLERIRNPRRNEHKWDISANRDHVGGSAL